MSSEYESEYDLWCTKCGKPVNTPEHRYKYECECFEAWGGDWDEPFPSFWQYVETKVATQQLTESDIPFE